MSDQINLTLESVYNKTPSTIANAIVNQFKKGLGIDLNTVSIHLTGEAKQHVDASANGYRDHDAFCEDILWHLKNLLQEKN
ncbi:hypothetical protein KGV55_01505 [Candidatus Gracilibacteria bacterium]|nr:hypothetical protein [Candidatus Gracilibacteria bacterium]